MIMLNDSTKSCIKTMIIPHNLTQSYINEGHRNNMDFVLLDYKNLACSNTVYIHNHRMQVIHPKWKQWMKYIRYILLVN